MQQAVGSFYEAVAGLQPLNRWEGPQSDTLAAANSPVGLHPAAKTVWTTNLPDRVLAIQASDATVAITTHDGSVSTLDAAGKLTTQETPTAVR